FCAETPVVVETGGAEGDEDDEGDEDETTFAAACPAESWAKATLGRDCSGATEDVLAALGDAVEAGEGTEDDESLVPTVERPATLVPRSRESQGNLELEAQRVLKELVTRESRLGGGAGSCDRVERAGPTAGLDGAVVNSELRSKRRASKVASATRSSSTSCWISFLESS
ncbi:hypothetical protein DFQ26_002368, partial [Actinomortierella ambigua]